MTQHSSFQATQAKFNASPRTIDGALEAGR